MDLALTTILGSADPRLCTQPQAPCRNVNLASARVALPRFCRVAQRAGGPLFLSAEGMTAPTPCLWKLPAPLGTKSQIHS